MSIISAQYPLVPLGEILTKSEDWIDIHPDQRYRQVTIRMWGQGVVQRNEVAGGEIAASRRLGVCAGQFILSRIDARNGALGIVPPELDGAVVSNDFPAFNVVASRILPEYLGWISRTHDFVELCKAASEGTTNRMRLQEDRFLALTIPLPPLAEQRRVVARIEALAAKIAEARRLRAEAVEEGKNLCRSMLFRAEESTPTPLSNLLTQRELNVNVSPEETYSFAGVYSFGEGVFRSQVKNGAEFAYTRLTRLRSGNFVYPKLMAWEGALGVVPPECDGCVVSPEFPVFEINTDRVLPETLDIYFRTPSVWPTLSGASTGTNIRRRRINPSEFLEYQIPLPPMHVQQHLRVVAAKVDALRALQGETATALAALLPAVLDRAFRGEL